MGKSVEAVSRIEGFWLWRPFGASYELTCQQSVDSLSSSWQGTVLLWMRCFSQKPRNRTGRPFHLQAKRKEGKNRCFPGRDACFLVENRGELISILQNLISLYYSPSLSLKVSPLQARGAEGQTLSLLPLSVLPPLSLLRRARHKIHPRPSLFLHGVLLVLFSYAFP